MNPTAWILNLHGDTIDVSRHWDCMHLFDAMADVGLVRYQAPTWPFPEPPSCVVIAGQHLASTEDVEQIEALLDAFGESATTVIVSSDEASLFPWWEIDHLVRRWWISTPRHDVHRALLPNAVADWGTRFFGEGPGPVPSGGWPVAAKDVDVSFAGQVTHQRRKEAVAALRSLPSTWTTEIVETPGFLQGLDRGTYLNQLARSRFVVCPSGVTSVDSFRLYETIECGAVPIVERRTPDGVDHRAWDLMYDHAPMPFPVVSEWKWLTEVVEDLLGDDAGYAALVDQCQLWWQERKQDLRDWLTVDCGLS